MDILGGILIGFCCLMLGWKLGKNRAENDALGIKCDGCTDYESYEAAKLDIRALEDMVKTLKRSRDQLKAENERLVNKYYYKNSFQKVV